MLVVFILLLINGRLLVLPSEWRKYEQNKNKMYANTDVKYKNQLTESVMKFSVEIEQPRFSWCPSAFNTPTTRPQRMNLSLNWNVQHYVETPCTSSKRRYCTADCTAVFLCPSTGRLSETVRGLRTLYQEDVGTWFGSCRDPSLVTGTWTARIYLCLYHPSSSF